MKGFTLNLVTNDKRYKVLNNCFIEYSAHLNCLVANIESYDREITNNIENSIYSFIRNNQTKIYKFFNSFNNSNLRVYNDNKDNFIQIDIFR